MFPPAIRLSKPVAGLLILFSLLFAPVLLFFGAAELRHPDVSPAYYAQNAVACIVAILLGVVLLLVAVGTVRGSLSAREQRRDTPPS
jgi:hypothetical protein